ncbi:MAG TPA: SH3 domain-containing protein, partial [Tahibacter sp.]|nr:SH3 domain-containing protein [Tahibacter sp.]
SGLLRQLVLLRRRQKTKLPKKSIKALLVEYQGVLTLIGLIATIFARPIERGWDWLDPPTFAPTAIAGQLVQLSYFTVVGDDVRLRIGPATTQRIVATVDRGDVVQRLGLCRGWSLVALHTGSDNGQPISGWIKSDYLKQLEAAGAVSKPLVVDGCRD